jgi:hypothetical protein
VGQKKTTFIQVCGSEYYQERCGIVTWGIMRRQNPRDIGQKWRCTGYARFTLSGTSRFLGQNVTQSPLTAFASQSSGPRTFGTAQTSDSRVPGACWCHCVVCTCTKGPLDGMRTIPQSPPRALHVPSLCTDYKATNQSTDQAVFMYIYAS